MKPEEVIAQYQSALDAAYATVNDVETRYNNAVQQLAAVPPPSSQSYDPTAAEGAWARVKELETSMAKAREQYATVLRQRADAATKARSELKTPEERTAYTARLEAQAAEDNAKAETIKQQNAERAANSAAGKGYRTNAEVEKSVRETPEAEGKTRSAVVGGRKVVQTSDGKGNWYISEDQGPADATQAPEAKGAKRTAVVGGRNVEQEADGKGNWVTVKDVGPVSKPEDALTPGGRAADQATATTALALAQTNLQAAQTNRDKAAVDLATAQRAARQAPTDAQAQKAIETAQKQLDLAVQRETEAIAQLRILNPIAASQAQATLDQTRATTQRTELGTLYGLDARIQAIKAQIASGQIKPEEGDALLQQEIRASVTGITARDDQVNATTIRQQDASLAASKAGNYTSGFGAAMSNFTKLNDTVQPGSDAAGLGFLASMRLLGNQLNTYGPAPSTAAMQSPLLQSVRPTPPPPAPPPAQVQTPTGMPPVTLNINLGSGAAYGGAAPQTPASIQANGGTLSGLLPAGVAGTAADPRNAVPAMLQPDAPATPSDVDRVWGRQTRGAMTSWD